MAEATNFKFGVQIDYKEYYHWTGDIKKLAAFDMFWYTAHGQPQTTVKRSTIPLKPNCHHKQKRPQTTYTATEQTIENTHDKTRPIKHKQVCNSLKHTAT